MFNLHKRRLKGGLDHSLQVSEGLSQGEGDRFFCQLQGTEFRQTRKLA